MLNVRHDLPVHSAAILLFPEADGPAMDGHLRLPSPDGRCRVDFRYHVARVWEMAPEALAAGLGTVPLAALVLPREEDLPPLVDNLKAEFARHPTSDEGEIWTALYILIGRRFRDVGLADRLLRGIQAMEDSVTYQVIMNKGRDKGRAEGRTEGRTEGRSEEAHALLLRQGTRRFGAPSESARARLGAIRDLTRLEDLADRILTAVDWDDFLGDSPQP